MTLVTPIQPKQTNCEVQKRAVNEHLAAAARMSEHSPHANTRQTDEQAALIAEMVEHWKTTAKLDRLFLIVLKNDYQKWNAIREIYALIDINEYTAYPVDWTRLFTPIEDMAWGELRCLGLPFFPQYPVLQFFADFADPIQKIVIECDGKRFHNKDRDAERDRMMIDAGWKVFRVSGSDCNRILESPFEKSHEFHAYGEELKAEELVRHWAKSTIDGLVWALAAVYYGSCNDEYGHIANEVLSARMVQF